MKKIISILLLLVVITGSLSLTFANQTPGEKLKSLGLVKGDTTGALLEDEQLTRADMMVMLARLYGVEGAAETFDQAPPFNDVSKNSYYASFIAYAYEKEWTKGTGAGEFSPDTAVDERMVATFMLRVLGYEVAWENALSEAKALGIKADASNGTFTRGDAFDMMYDTINTKVSGEAVVLGEKLGIDEAVELLSATPVANTEITLTFSSPLKAASVTPSLFKIEGVYDGNNGLSVIETVVNNETVTLKVSPMENVFYEITVGEDLKDLYGNPVDLEENTQPFLGREVAEAIDAMAIERIDATTLAITFNENIDEQAEALELYSIEGELLAPQKVEKASLKKELAYKAVSDYKKTILMTLPETKAGEVYTLAVAKGLKNIDGVATTEVLTATFTGAGITKDLPKIEDVIALNSQSLEIYFDRGVNDETIEGRLWDAKDHRIYGPNILTIDATGNKRSIDPEDFDLYDAGNSYVYASDTSNNALIVQFNRPVFEEASTSIPDNIFHLMGNSMYVYSQEETNILDFSANNKAVEKPSIEAVTMVDQKTINVTFTGPVKFEVLDTDALKILKEPGDFIDNTLITTVKNITSRDNKQWTMALEESITSSDVIEDKAFFYLPDGLFKDITGTVDVMASDTTENYQSIEFAMNYSGPEGIEKIIAMMPDRKTLEVTYPEGMNPGDVLSVRNYALLSHDTTEASVLEGVNFKSGYSTYAKENNRVQLYLDESITNTSPSGEYYLAIDGRVENALGTKTIADTSVGDLKGVPSASGLVLQFAPNTKAPMPPTLESAVVSDDRYTLRVKFNEDIAFSDANNAFVKTADLTSGLSKFELLQGLQVKVQFENDATPSLAEAADIDTIAGLGSENEQEIKITFNEKLAVGSMGHVTTRGANENKIFNRKSEPILVDKEGSQVTFGVSKTLYPDGKPPTLLLEASYGVDSDGDGKLNEVVLVYDENMKLTETLETNAKARTLITALTVDDGRGEKELRGSITGVTVNGPEVIIALEDLIAGTGEINLSIDADTNGTFGQLQDTSVLKASDQKMISLPDKVSPVLMHAFGEIGSEAILLSFSEKVSGGVPRLLENIQVSDLNWQDQSGDGASFIKFVLSSKNKADQGIVVNTAITLSDIGEDTINVLEESVFDASGNPASTRAVILEGN